MISPKFAISIAFPMVENSAGTFKIDAEIVPEGRKRRQRRTIEGKKLKILRNSVTLRFSGTYNPNWRFRGLSKCMYYLRRNQQESRQNPGNRGFAGPGGNQPPGEGSDPREGPGSSSVRSSVPGISSEGALASRSRRSDTCSSSRATWSRGTR